MKFYADEMLGKLARWLRMSGQDVAYQRQVQDDDLIAAARREARFILTRDTRLIRRLRPEEFLFIHHDHLAEQFQECLERFPDAIEIARSLTRCVECNTSLEAVAKESVRDQVWPYVFAHQEKFTRCPQCGKIYWRATHVARIEAKLRGLLGVPGAADPTGFKAE